MENHGLQCGYCTPGMVMAATSLLDENPHPTEREVRIGLEGNLCRCTGYHNIVAGRPRRRRRSQRMIPAAFDYVRAGSAEEAISLLGEHGDEAKFLAGGHSLLPLMKLRLAQPSVLVDIGRLSDLSYIRDAGDHIAIGALTRHTDVEHVRRARRARPAAGPRRQPRRRPAGPPPRHHRRLDRPRRPGLRPAGHHAGPRRHVRRPGPERHPRDRRRRLLRELPRRRRWRPTSCSPRSASPRCRAPAGASRSSTGGPRTGPSSASPPGAATATPASGSSTWARRRSSPPASRSALSGGASVEDAAEQAVAEADPQADLNASVEYRTHLAKVLTRRALEAASS